MDLGYYKPDGTYTLAPFQPQLTALLGSTPFIGSRVALVDLTKDRNAPEFAGVRHMQQVFIASVAKIAPLFAAFQLQQDIRAMARRPTPTGGGVFDWARDLWADTQHDHGGASVPFTKDIELRGKLVLVKGKKMPLIDLRAPRLDAVFAAEAKPFAFASTPKTRAELETAIKEYARIGKPAIEALAFMQRLMVVGGGLVPASNFATTTIVRDLGFPYIASALMQSGLYDPARGGGLWFNDDYGGHTWPGLPAGGPINSGTPGSLASYMTLLAQDRLVSRRPARGSATCSTRTRRPCPPCKPLRGRTGRRFGLAARVFEKIGVAAGGVDECAYIEWPEAAPRLKYVAVRLRSSDTLLRKLIVELHKIVAANNGVALPPLRPSVPYELTEARTNDAGAEALTSRCFRSHFEACGICVDAQHSATVRVRVAGRHGRVSVIRIRSSLTRLKTGRPTGGPHILKPALDRYCVTCHNATAEDRGAAARPDGPRPRRRRRRGLGESRAQAAHARDAAARTPAARSGHLRQLDRALETALDRGSAASPNPGRVPVHRLNRTEYANAIRDLLALEIDGRALLPADEPDQQGFDNVASVLSVSPRLLENYLSAATTVSRLAHRRSRRSTRSSTRFKIPTALVQDDRASDDLPFGSRGGTSIRYQFPLDGEYSIKVLLKRQLYLYLIGHGRAAPDRRASGRRADQAVHGRRRRQGHDGARELCRQHAGRSGLGSLHAHRRRRSRVRVPVKPGTHEVGVSFVQPALGARGHPAAAAARLRADDQRAVLTATRRSRSSRSAGPHRARRGRRHAEPPQVFVLPSYESGRRRSRARARFCRRSRAARIAGR